MTKVSFIVPSYNSFKTIGSTLESIFNLKSYDKIKEIIVVDSSDDGETRGMLNDSRIKAILLDQKTFPAAGRNIGAKHASGSLLCFIDSDVYLDEHWLENILSAYDSGCQAGGGSIFVPDFQENNNLALAQLYLQVNEFLDSGERRIIGTIAACNMFVDAKLFEKIDGFPNIRASEEVLLCLKIKEFAPVWFLPEARCFHTFRESLESYRNNQKMLGKYIIIYRRMTYNKWYYRGIWPILLLPIFLLIKITRIKCRIFKAGWRHYKKLIGCSGLFIAGLWWWAVGFYQGCFSKE